METLTIKDLKEIEYNLDAVNYELIREKRKTKKQKLLRLKRKLLKQYKTYKRSLKVLHRKHDLDVWNIDLTSMSVVAKNENKARYLRNMEKYFSDYNFLVAFNFKRNIGFSLLTKYQQITKTDLAIIQNYIRRIDKYAEIITDNRHKYTNNLNKDFTMEIERLFAWIKHPILKEIKDLRYTKRVKGKSLIFHDLDVNILLSMYKQQFKYRHIQPINF